MFIKNPDPNIEFNLNEINITLNSIIAFLLNIYSLLKMKEEKSGN